MMRVQNDEGDFGCGQAVSFNLNAIGVSAYAISVAVNQHGFSPPQANRTQFGDGDKDTNLR